MRGLSSVAGVPLEHLVGLVAAVAAEVAVQQVHHRPQVAALLDVDLEQVAQVVQARRGEAQVALLLDRRRLGVALHDDRGGAGRRGTRPAPPATPARPCGRRRRCAGRAPARRGRCPSGSRASSRGRSWPSPPGRRRWRCAGTRRCPGTRPGPSSLPPVDELRLPRLERPLQPAVARPGRRCWGSWRRCRRRSCASYSDPRSVVGRARARCRSGAARRRGRRRSGAGRSSSARPSGGRRSWSPSSRGRRSGGSPPCR